MDWQRQLDERPAPPDIALESLMSIQVAIFYSRELMTEARRTRRTGSY